MINRSPCKLKKRSNKHLVVVVVVVSILCFCMDLRITGVPLKVGIGLVKIDFLALLKHSLFVTLDYWQPSV